MKKSIFIFLIIIGSLLLSQLTGCTSGAFSDQPDIERLLPVQTLGFDREGSGMVVTLSTGKELQSASPLVMQSLSSGIEAALTRLQDYSPEDQLYYDHIQYIMLGESVAEAGVEPILDWAERSPFMRMDTFVLLVKGSAGDAMTGASGEMADVTERLSSLEREASTRGQHIYTLLEIASSLADRNSALCTVVEAVSSQGTVYTPQGDSIENAILPAGSAVLKDGRLISYLSQNESLGAALFQADPNGTTLTLEGTTMEILQGHVRASGQWSERGELTGIRITGELSAGILEQENPDQDIDHLNQVFTDTAQRWVTEALARSQTLSCDFLALQDPVLRSGPHGGQAYRAVWEEIFPTLPISVEITAEVTRGYDRTK